MSLSNCVAICELKLESHSANSQIEALICSDFHGIDLWPPTVTFWKDTTFVNGKKIHDDEMTGILWKICQRQ